MIRPVVRVALVVVGLAAAVYGMASLTGGWLGTPPWRDPPRAQCADLPDGPICTDFPSGPIDPATPVVIRVPKTPANRHAVGAAAVTVGLALAAFGAWPRRRSPASSP